MNLATFIPVITVEKEGGKERGNFGEKYRHFQSIEKNYQKVESFLDAKVHRRNPEVEKLRQKRQKAVSNITLIMEMEYNTLSGKIQQELENAWRVREKTDRKIHQLMKDLSGNHIFYKRIKRVVKRFRSIEKSAKDLSPLIAEYIYFFQRVDEFFASLYSLEPEQISEINHLLTELDIATQTLKRFISIIRQISPYYRDWFSSANNVPDFVRNKRERRLDDVLLKLDLLQMESALTEEDLDQMVQYMEILREIPSWDPRLGLEKRIIVSMGDGNQLTSLSRPISEELRKEFHDPVGKFVMPGEVFLYDETDIILALPHIEDREALANWKREEDKEEVDAFLFRHTTKTRKYKEKANCVIHVSGDGHYFLYASRNLEKGEFLKNKYDQGGIPEMDWLGRTNNDSSSSRGQTSQNFNKNCLVGK